jgi:hypothetical protein
MSALCCVVCGSPKVFRRERCDWCYRFLRRHGRDRTESELAERNYRRFLREEEAKLVRRLFVRASTSVQTRRNPTKG